MKLESHPQELTQVPFSKTECGVDFNINTDTHERLLVRIKEELNHPLADSYHIIVSLLHYLLMTLNRRYSAQYHLPFDAPKNHHAFEFKQLLEKHIRQYQQVADYAAMLNISRITLNASAQAQYGQTAVHLLKQRLLAEIKNEIFFTDKTTRI